MLLLHACSFFLWHSCSYFCSDWLLRPVNQLFCTHYHTVYRVSTISTYSFPIPNMIAFRSPCIRQHDTSYDWMTNDWRGTQKAKARVDRRRGTNKNSKQQKRHYHVALQYCEESAKCVFAWVSNERARNVAALTVQPYIVYTTHHSKHQQTGSRTSTLYSMHWVAYSTVHSW